MCFIIIQAERARTFAQLIQLNNFLIKLKTFEKYSALLDKNFDFFVFKKQTNLSIDRQEKAQKSDNSNNSKSFFKVNALNRFWVLGDRF